MSKRDFLQHSTGFINIDKDGLCFNNSGNWGVVEQMKINGSEFHLGMRVHKKKKFKYLRLVYVLLSIAFVFCVYFRFYYFALIAAVVAYATHMSLHEKKNNQFIIKPEQIRQIRIAEEENEVEFIFNHGNQEASISVHEVSKEAMDILSNRFKLLVHG